MSSSPSSQGDSVSAAAPSYDFRNNVDTSRFTKAIYIVDSTATPTFEVANEFAAAPDDSVTFRLGGQILPVRTKTAVTVTGYDVIYFY